MTIPTLTPASLSQLDQAAFVAALDGIFEHSPWVAERAWVRRPLCRPGSPAGHAGWRDAGGPRCPDGVDQGSPGTGRQGGGEGELTAESTREQAGAGLAACSPEEFELIQALNGAYNAKFGFPFIIAVRGLGRADIIAAMERRLGHDPEAEFAEALRQIARIAALRLEERVAE
jgi:2-oxo-4-hydroxy-4-carboxy--5-ureidoimidazoline (OHCU) decarboxylase